MKKGGLSQSKKKNNVKKKALRSEAKSSRSRAKESVSFSFIFFPQKLSS